MNDTNSQQNLYQLLPAVYRERDAAEGYPLKALLDIIQEQADLLKTDIEGLYNNFFIDTCTEWVVPYIGDLVGNNLLHGDAGLHTDETAKSLFPFLKGPDLLPETAVRTRADVAKTIYYRRRKGTPAMLEELARDVTGYPVHVVEFFERTGWSEFMNHVKPCAEDCADLRSPERLDRIGGPFDTCLYTADVRYPAPSEGWYNIPNIGFFIYRLKSYPLTRAQARPGALPWHFYFSPLGNLSPLFSTWRREGEALGLASEIHMPAPIRRLFFSKDLEDYQNSAPPRADITELYGNTTDNSFFVEVNGKAGVAPDPDFPPDQDRPHIVCRQLRPWPAARPSGAVIAVDVESGRIALGDGFTEIETVDVSYCYGFSADLGGGPYERGKWITDSSLADLHLFVEQDGAFPDSFTTLSSALAEWVSRGRPNAVITILDNRTYAEPLTLELADAKWLVIEAANGVRPHIQPNLRSIRIQGNHPESALTLSGLLVEGGVDVTGDLGFLRVLHTTLVPGRGLDESGSPVSSEPSVAVSSGTADDPINTDMHLEIAFSIAGPIRISESASKITVLDTIIDGLGQAAIAAFGTSDGMGPAAHLERVTVFGKSCFRKIDLASETIFSDIVYSAERHQGCVRFSYVPPNSRTPQRFRCQPDLAQTEAVEALKKQAAALGKTLTAFEIDAERQQTAEKIVPSFAAEDYGLPSYGQLRILSPKAIQRGAEDGSEMGAFSMLKHAQRETNLLIRLDEYLPFGLFAGFIYVT